MRKMREKDLFQISEKYRRAGPSKLEQSIERLKKNPVLPNLYWGGILLFLVYVAVSFVLNRQGLAFRGWIQSIMMWLFFALALITAARGIVWMFKRAAALNEKARKASMRVSAVLLIVVTVFAAQFFLLYGAFSHRPEHIVTKYGVEMVASVYGNEDTAVDYYVHKNFLLRGSEVLGTEVYTGLEEDPYTMETRPEPSYYAFAFTIGEASVEDSRLPE